MTKLLGTVLVLMMVLQGCTVQGDDMSTTEDSEIPKDRPVRTGWSKNGTLTAGVVGQSEQMQAEFSSANSYTLVFDISPLGPDNFIGGVQQFIQKAEALIVWNLDGNSVTRRVTIGKGTSIQAVADGVKVIMMDKSIFVGAGAPPAPKYNVSVQVGRGSRGTTAQPPILMGEASVVPLGLPNVILNAGQHVDVPVPQDAGVNSVFVSMVGGNLTVNPPALVPIPESTGYVEQQGVAGANTVQIYDPRAHDWVPLGPGVTSIRLVNKFGAGPSTQIEFCVSFGIDG